MTNLPPIAQIDSRPPLLLLAAGILLLSAPPGRAQPRIEFSASRVEIGEDQRDPTVSVRLVDCAARTPTGRVDVRVLADAGSAEEGIDFFAFGHTLLGTAEGTATSRVFRQAEIPIEIVHDDLEETAEEFALRIELGAGSGIDCGDGPRMPEVGPPVLVRILDVPADLSLVSFATGELHLTEADGAETREARIAVSRTQGRMPVSVICQTNRSGSASEGEDFEPVATVLGWAEEEQGEKWCVVRVLADELAEKPETIGLSLLPVSGKLEIGTGRATLYVNDDDSPGRVQFTAVRFDASEEEGEAIVRLERRWGNEGPSSVRVLVTPLGARPGEDFEPVAAELVWASGEEGPRELRIPLVDDTLPEAEESLMLKLEAATAETLLGDLKNAVLVIADGDAQGDDYAPTTASTTVVGYPGDPTESCPLCAGPAGVAPAR